MPPQIATVLVVVGIAGLFWLDRDGSARPSKALWLAVLWVWISGSRPVSALFGMSPPAEIPGQLPQTSAIDQTVAAVLLLWAAMILMARYKKVTGLLKASWPIVLYFSFSLFSLLWSDFPEWGLKRWVRGLGDLAMVLIIVTDIHPTTALRRFLSRVGFVLLPLSVLLIKYYPGVGREFGEYGNEVVNVGVTTNKNTLGALVFVITLGTLWQVLSLLRDKEQPNRTRRLLAQCTLLVFGIDLLFTAHSATAGASFALGALIMLALARPYFRVRPQAVHALLLAILLAGGLTELFGLRDAALNALGRKPDLTGRTEIWETVIPMVPNSIGGAGFETFWCGPRVAKFYALHGGISMTNEAHNGYIEVYLNLGLLGVCLIGLILVQGYGRAVRAFRRDRALGALLVAYVFTAVSYNIGEAGFRILSMPWFFLLLSIVAANRVINLDETLSESAREFAASPPGELGYPQPQPDLYGEL